MKPGDHEISLNDVCAGGAKVVDVYGFVDYEFGFDTPVFHITRVVLDSEECVFAEGEHDLPYLPAGPELSLPEGEEEDDE